MPRFWYKGCCRVNSCGLFQFHTGSIKSLSRRICNYVIDHRERPFQFHTGSIKSIDELPLDIAGRWSTFRFHTGSIKSWAISTWQTVKNPFQFHTGSIKSGCKGDPLSRFQFHTGSIKRLVMPDSHRNRRESWFQFHTGSIKRTCQRNDSLSLSTSWVSIPYWFD